MAITYRGETFDGYNKPKRTPSHSTKSHVVLAKDGQWHWREGCDDCTRRTRPDPADGVVEPPPIIAFECELRIEPLEITP